MNKQNQTIKKENILSLGINILKYLEQIFRLVLRACNTICLITLTGYIFGIISPDALFKLNPQVNNTVDHTNKTRGLISVKETNLRFKISQQSSVIQIDTRPYISIHTNGIISNCLDNNNKSSDDISIVTENFYCIDFTDRSYSIEDYIFYIEYCNGKSICKSREEIDKLFFIADTIQVHYAYDDYAVHPTKYKYPIELKPNYYDSFIRPNISIENSLRFTPYKILTDDGLIYSNKYLNTFNNNTILHIFDEKIDHIVYPNNCINHPNSCNRLFNLNIKSYSKIITIERTYQRLFNNIANFKAFVGFLVVVIVLLDV